MSILNKLGDGRHRIHVPQHEAAPKEVGNIFGVKHEGVAEDAAPMSLTQALDLPEAPTDPETQTPPPTSKRKKSWLRMPLFIRLWGRG